MADLYRKVGEMEFDGLISDTTPPVQVRAVTIAASSTPGDKITIKRGTVGAKMADGKITMLGAVSPEGEEKFDGDGSTKTFTLEGKPSAVNSVTVGTTEQTIDDYNAYTGVVTLHTAPAAGTDNVVVKYANDNAPEPYAILTDDIVLTDEEDVVTTAYTAGCFDPNKVIVAEGYEMTDADFDTLRKYGIVFKAAQN